MGAPGFAPPEQYSLLCAKQDRRIDLFALGVLLYLMLAGEKAYSGLVLDPEQPLPPPPLSATDWPGLNELVMGLIQPNRDRRKPASAIEVMSVFDSI